MSLWLPVFILFAMGEFALIIYHVLPSLYVGSISLNVLKKPLLQLTVFLTAFVFVNYLEKKFDYSVLKNKRIAYLFIGFSTLMLVLVLINKLLTGKAVNRWLFGGSIQPLEFTKLSVIVFLSYYVYSKGGAKEFRYIFWASFLVGLNAVLLFLQPDKGGAVSIMTLTLLILFAGGMPAKVYLPVTLGFVLLSLPFLRGGYVKERVLAWKDPFSDPTDSGYQIIQSLYAFAHGGLFGTGIGQGVQKLKGGLPLADTDYIIALIAEEFGFVGVLMVSLVYAYLVGYLMVMSIRVKDIFGKLLLFGCASSFALSFLWNLAMATNLLPSKGIALPFLSYGLSNLLMSTIMVGLCNMVIKKYTV
ncbi:FtsW/RodA/SpoVE family cell cycle protein [Thermocrinis minervae]|uniref:Probable peptidoglycan glycosyltransferase FtsW n=1 Tax=Thermocrinis minervae TaxID=381751 RepID=A0A1M6QN13_9AQUI|nr:FtsW/RodA/SpoVE family cell cycle protein [Thermocrinis minervae]SHK21652.1 cell division protein FtsW [Thermocrinis minervae]